MSAEEALARVLDAEAMQRARYAPGVIEQAERILADPAPLLAALAEAGVLTEQQWRRAIDQKAHEVISPAQRRYVSEWRDIGSL